MRQALLGVLLLGACVSPEDAFVLRGAVVDEVGRPMPDQEVRILRDRSIDSERCWPMEPFTTLTTDREGRFSLTVFRQQQTLGGRTPRFFRVEASALPGWASAQTFRFPAADVTLSDLPVSTLGTPVPAMLFESFTEGTLDESLAWRSGFGGLPAEERETPLRSVDRQVSFASLPSTGLGTFEELAVELRLERPAEPVMRGPVSRFRNLACDVVPQGEPCPLTDGRMVPVKLPPGTKTVAITSGQLEVVRSLAVRGLQVEGEPDRLLVETATSLTTPDWRPVVRVTRAREAIAAGRNHCRDPGAFFSFEIGTVAAQGFRLRVEDAAGSSLDLTWLAEVTAR